MKGIAEQDDLFDSVKRSAGANMIGSRGLTRARELKCWYECQETLTANKYLGRQIVRLNAVRRKVT